MDTTDTTDTTDTKSTDRRYSQRSRYCRDRCGLTGIKNFGLMVMEAMAAKTGYSRTLRLKDKSWRHVSLLKWTRFHQRKRQERPWESINSILLCMLANSRQGKYRVSVFSTWSRQIVMEWDKSSNRDGVGQVVKS